MAMVTSASVLNVTTANFGKPVKQLLAQAHASPIPIYNALARPDAINDRKGVRTHREVWR